MAQNMAGKKGLVPTSFLQALNQAPAVSESPLIPSCPPPDIDVDSSSEEESEDDDDDDMPPPGAVKIFIQRPIQAELHLAVFSFIVIIK